MSFVETAYAMAPQAGGGGEPNMLTSLVPFALIFVVFYFLLIRPQQKKAKEQRAMIANLKKGDAVITAGGIFGRIVDVDGDVMIVDLGETKVSMNRSYLSAVPQQRQAAPPVKKEKKVKKDARESKEVRETASPAVDEAPAEAVRTENPTAEPASAEAKTDEASADSGNDTGKPAAQ